MMEIQTGDKLMEKHTSILYSKSFKVGLVGEVSIRLALPMWDIITDVQCEKHQFEGITIERFFSFFVS